ncbi:MAG: hypothetical protein H7Z74_10765 [Anaerolineae bacterium]|nr:hypothetical protein [Gemmatimonadaceae bacterium]
MTSSSVVALVVLPQRYNPDAKGKRRGVEDAKFEETMGEIASRFGGGVLWRYDSAPPRGFWWDRGVLYADEMTVVEVDIPNDATARQWLIEYARNTLGPRFKQKAIYLRFVGPIEVDVVTVDIE